jgi:hypothetical protein
MFPSLAPGSRLRRRLLRCWEIGIASLLLAAAGVVVLTAPELHAAIQDHRSLARPDAGQAASEDAQAHCGNAQTSADVYTK